MLAKIIIMTMSSIKMNASDGSSFFKKLLLVRQIDMILILESVQITCLQMLKPFHSDVCSRLNRFASSPCTVLEAAILIMTLDVITS